MHLIAQMYNIYDMSTYTLWQAHNAGGGDESTRCGGTERVAGGHIMPVAVMVAPAVGGQEDASHGWRGSGQPH